MGLQGSIHNEIGLFCSLQHDDRMHHAMQHLEVLGTTELHVLPLDDHDTGVWTTGMLSKQGDLAHKHHVVSTTPRKKMPIISS